MKAVLTPFKDLMVLEPTLFGDQRGYFFESYSKRSHLAVDIKIDFVQDNQSRSVKNVIRGLHFQNAPYAQTKLIRVLQGNIYDVVVDLRKDQPTFKNVYGIELSSENRLQLLIPKGFAHGFSVLSDVAEILYKCDEYYFQSSESGILYNDPELNIDWKVNVSDALVSDKDKKQPRLSEAKFEF
ncbi:MAG: dTDP-4-dehydrorhamnose 3,5-epimerase [Cyclobacteriaceae bacterium]|nr:dTDP-4-dehydrorhamnose 3,5-epimerase [Cyclobacteriaceae bacterium]